MRNKHRHQTVTPGTRQDIRKRATDLQTYRQNKRYCILLLCLTVPLILPDTVTIWQTTVRNSMDNGKAILSMCFEEAKAHLELTKLEAILDSFVEFFLRLAHDSNFFLYVALSQRFRLAFLRTFCGGTIGAHLQSPTTVRPAGSVLPGSVRRVEVRRVTWQTEHDERAK